MCVEGRSGGGRLLNLDHEGLTGLQSRKVEVLRGFNFIMFFKFQVEISGEKSLLRFQSIYI